MAKSKAKGILIHLEPDEVRALDAEVSEARAVVEALGLKPRVTRTSTAEALLIKALREKGVKR